MTVSKKALFRQTLVVIAAGLLCFNTGTTVGWISPEIRRLRKLYSQIEVSDNKLALLTSCHEIGRLVMAIPAGLLADRFGRRPVIISAALVATFAWLLVSITTNFYLLFLARFLLGTAMGTSNPLHSIYYAEVSSPEIRGLFFTVLYGIYYTGVLWEYILGTVLDYQYVNITSLFSCATFFLLIQFVVETPSYLIKKGKSEDALFTLAWLKAEKNVANLKEEIYSLQKYVDSDQEVRNKFSLLFSTAINRKCLYLVCAINSLTQFTGFTAVMSFSSLLFPSDGSISPKTFAILLASFQFVASFCAAPFSDNYGRRTLYIAASIVATLSHFVTGLVYYLQNNSSVKVPGYSWILLASISIYACTYCTAMGPLTSAIRGELFPYNVKGISAGFSILSSSATAFFVVFTFHWFKLVLGLACAFWIFGVFSVILGFFVFFNLPETNRKSLAVIHQELIRDHGKSVWRKG